ncbi:copper homeostasis membrane protein CopD [Tatumella citrea]|uniref:Copper resistance protein D n=1 Tax=Tatumella citrea TaxID=53336 RepID=A0A1Y0LKA2_TATCI|nr:copper homeostasis membrane protein CopD [Tatumella citrea]ARU94195.1 hypothetical protein A7K98_10675 [Tatumella citrea]ARU98235.1 hypothetical protein A7K99_10675 [Tatumella citrea]
MIAASYILLRFVHFTSLILLTGCASYRAILAPGEYAGRLWSRIKVCSLWAAVIAFISAVAMFAVQTILMSGETDAIWQASVWYAVSGTRFGQAWLPVMLLALFSVLLHCFSGRRVGLLLLTGCVVGLMFMATTGHAAMHDGGRGIAGQLSQAIHLTAAAFWCGGLLPLLRLMKQAADEPDNRNAIRTMMKFSRFGHWAVAMTIISGMLNTLLIAGFPLHWSAWLQWLLIKVTLVLVMVAIALFNRYWLVPRFNRPPYQSHRWFIRLTQLELLISLVVIAVVSLFATLSPV